MAYDAIERVRTKLALQEHDGTFGRPHLPNVDALLREYCKDDVSSQNFSRRAASKVVFTEFRATRSLNTVPSSIVPAFAAAISGFVVGGQEGIARGRSARRHAGCVAVHLGKDWGARGGGAGQGYRGVRGSATLQLPLREAPSIVE